VITAKEVFEKLSTLDRRVDRLAGGFDAMEGKSDDHETCIRSLEGKMWAAPVCSGLWPGGSSGS
jgi:hypothetical protein